MEVIRRAGLIMEAALEREINEYAGGGWMNPGVSLRVAGGRGG